jgi:hypothetical protein
MYEQDKLDEAGHFLAGMTESVEDPMAFRFELSAFLSSARSVLQYALEEAKTKTGGQAWFDGHASSNQVIRFFRGKRNLSIHTGPIVPAATVNIVATDVIHFSEAVFIQVFDNEGNLISEQSSGSPTSPPVTSPPPSVSRVYNFPDWSGPEDVLQLCDAYIRALEAIVNEGRAQGFLT